MLGPRSTSVSGPPSSNAFNFGSSNNSNSGFSLGLSNSNQPNTAAGALFGTGNSIQSNKNTNLFGGNQQQRPANSFNFGSGATGGGFFGSNSQQSSTANIGAGSGTGTGTGLFGSAKHDVQHGTGLFGSTLREIPLRTPELGCLVIKMQGLVHSEQIRALRIAKIQRPVLVVFSELVLVIHRNNRQIYLETR